MTPSSAARFRLEHVSFLDLPGWAQDDPSSLFPAMQACRDHLAAQKPYRTGQLGLTTADLLPLLDQAAKAPRCDAAGARRFFEETCYVFKIELDDQRGGFVTAYFEPEVLVRDRQDDAFRYPFYRVPHDLVEIDEDNRPVDWDPAIRFARRLETGSLAEFPDRRALQGGFLDGRQLEIAWAQSKVEVFFAHVQGAARLRYEDGVIRRITYAAKSGHPFSAIGRLLIDQGELNPKTISMQSIRDWLLTHPDRVDEVLAHNRSYIFFREADVDDPSLGPVAAAKVPLVAGRSLAVDRLIHTFGFPFFVNAPKLTHLDQGEPFRRLLLALDTGSAIVGPARGDIFVGSGYDAGEQAGTVRHEADFYILIPKASATRFL